MSTVKEHGDKGGLKYFIDAVQAIAFEIPPCNPYTPRLVQLCQDARVAFTPSHALEKCPTCGGTGNIPQDAACEPKPCLTCEGRKTIKAFTPSTTPRSATPRTAAIARKWSLKGGGTNTSDASPEAKELYEHAEQLEHTLAGVREVLRQSDAENDELRQENGALSAASAIVPSHCCPHPAYCAKDGCAANNSPDGGKATNG